MPFDVEQAYCVVPTVL